MQTRLLRRRSVTALGLYAGVGLGFLASVLAARQLGPTPFGLFTLAISAVGFFQVLFDLTVEEAMIKYGFRYTTTERWGRLRRLYRQAMTLKTIGAVLAGIAVVIAAPFSSELFHAHHLETPFLLSALLPITYIPEAPAGAALVLTGRYDVRAGFNFLTALLRSAGLIVGAHYGVTAAVAGLVVGQFAGSLAVGATALRVFAHFPASAQEPLGDDRREIIHFVIRSSIGSGIAALRTYMAPLLLGKVSNPKDVGYFKAGMTPHTGLTGLTSPARLILLTEQTRDWETGAFDRVFAGVRRYTIGALGLMVVAVPLFYWQMPNLVRFAYGAKFAPATEPARLILVAGAIALVLAWTNWLPVSIGRPGLRILTESIFTVVLVPLVLVFGSIWHATGAAAGFLIATGAFAIAWLLILATLRREHT